MRKPYLVLICILSSMLVACGGGGDSSSSSGSDTTTSNLSLAAQVGRQLFFDQNLSGRKNMSCATCHSPAYAYGPPNSLSVQLGSDPSQAGQRAVPSLRYKSMTPTYSDNSKNPDGVSQNAPGGGFMWDGRAPSLAAQAALPLLNPIEMNNSSQAAVVQAVQSSSYASLFQQAFGAGVFGDISSAFNDIGLALQAFQTESPDFQPESSKIDLFLAGKATLTAAETRGLNLFNGTANCVACHYTGSNFNATQYLGTDFTYQALGVPRNDASIPGNPSPIPDNANASYYDMGLCGPSNAGAYNGHTSGTANSGAGPDPYTGTYNPDPYCGRFKVPTLRNVATRTAFFHNGVFHSLVQVVNFYNTRDTNPEYWYPSTGGDSGNVTTNPNYALFPTYASGATVNKFNDLPTQYQGNIDEELPMGQGQASATATGVVTTGANATDIATGAATVTSGPTTALNGALPRTFHSQPLLQQSDIADIVCFLNTLTDGYQPPATQPTSGTCVN